ncbi:hypothetical protein L596_007615 [Steinernema carpocapsae]|uniref:Peptidase M13 C-terminal domain-containing protein n=1 Tax=Steinernema carpocapsae TaxID=34508 RepID=A0A4U5P9V6_STECR|nr:hypothetical protein L596_007615 [Steinernema carpocapsae]
MTLLYLLLFLPAIKASVPFVFRQKFSAEFGVCEDFLQHVCNLKENKPEDFLRNNELSGFQKAIEEPFFESDDVGLNRIRNLYYVEEEHNRLWKMGNETGVIVAKNESDILVKFVQEGGMTTIQITTKSEPEASSRHCVITACPSFIQGIVRGFKMAEGPEDKLSPLAVVQLSDKIEIPKIELDEQTKKDISRKLLRDNGFQMYVNVIVVKLAVKNGIHLTPEGREKLQNMTREITQAIIQKIQALKWLENRDEIVTFYKNIEFTFDIPQQFIDRPELIDEQLAFFEKMVQDYYQKALQKKGACDTTCQKGVLSTLYLLAFERYNQDHPDNLGYLIPPGERLPTTLVGFGGRNKGTSVLLYPETVQIMNDPSVPEGLLYGTVGYILAHELFHSIGFNEAETAHMRELAADPRFKSAAECYAEHYSSLLVYNKSTTLPLEVKVDGKQKIDEGYADIEGARLLYGILKEKMLRAAPTEKKEKKMKKREAKKAKKDKKTEAKSVEVDELKWFFYGVGSTWCPNFATQDPLTTLEKSHPAFIVRTNALLKQIPEFAKHFGCGKNDKMFQSKNICNAFPKK